MSERYTLAEAQTEIARRECATTGHLLDVIELVGSGDPQGIVCTRCGRTWDIAESTDVSLLGFHNGRLVAISVDGDHSGIADDWRDRGYAILRVPAAEALRFWAEATDGLHPAGVEDLTA